MLNLKGFQLMLNLKGLQLMLNLKGLQKMFNVDNFFIVSRAMRKLLIIERTHKWKISFQKNMIILLILDKKKHFMSNFKVKGSDLRLFNI